MKKYLLKSLYLSGLLIILYFWWPSQISLYVFGKLFGLLGAYLTLVQLLLIGRVKWIERVFGHDKLAKFHHTSGYYAYSFLVAHFSIMLLTYGLEVLTFEDTLKAFIGFCILTFTIFLSVKIVRSKLQYETWYYVHVLVYLFIALAFSHQLQSGSDFYGNNLFIGYWYFLYIFVFVNLIYFRFFLPLWLFAKYRFFVSEVKKETADTTSVYISGRDIKNLKVIPGQFIIVRFLTKKLWWQAHPFSVSDYFNNQNIRLTIKNSGDFTAEIPSLKVRTPVVIDGPHGGFTTENITKNKFLLIAGGVGITPIRTILEDLVSKKLNVALLYSTKEGEEIIFKQELDILQTKYNFKFAYFAERIDGEKIKTQVPDFQDREIFICGPVPMMDAISKDLQDRGVTNSLIHTERFSL